MPGRVQAQEFDLGGEGVAYHDTSAGNEYGDVFRDSDVDIRETQDDSGEHNVGYFQDGEWLEYTIDPEPGTYDVHIRLASERSGRQLRVLVDGAEVGVVNVPNTGDWSSWETVTLEDVTVEGGEQVVRFEAVGSGIDFNWFEVATDTDEDFGELGYGAGGYGGTE